MATPAELAAVLPNARVVIGGDVAITSSATMPHYYPGTGEQIAESPLGSAAEVDVAVQAARAAFPGWQRVSPAVRRDLMLRFAELVAADAERLTVISVLDNGIAADGLVSLTSDLFRYNAGWADKIEGAVVPTWPGPALDYTLLGPLGVVGIIIPWNGPLLTFATTVAPALAAGNCVVVKPSELAPFVCLRLGELFRDAGFPDGVVNIVAGAAAAGEALARHQDIDKLHFTGSVRTARSIIEASAQGITPLGLELGGKSANIVLEDSDLGAAARSVLRAATVLNGQGCTNGTRVLVQRSVRDQFVALVAERLQAIRLGDCLRGAADVGPVVTGESRDRIRNLIERAVASNAGTPIVGGTLPAGLESGYFVQPTVFVDTDPDSEIAQEEIFGPVLSVSTFSDDDEAIALANSTRYGLAAYLHTTDLRRAHRVAASMEAGMVWINGPGAILPSVPFGGVKHSGYGRLGGHDGIREFSRAKNIWVRA